MRWHPTDGKTASASRDFPDTRSASPPNGFVAANGHLRSATSITYYLRTACSPLSEGAALATTGIGGNIGGVLEPRAMRTTASSSPSTPDPGSDVYRFGSSHSAARMRCATSCSSATVRCPYASGYLGYAHAWSRVFPTALTSGEVNVVALDHAGAMTMSSGRLNPIPQDWAIGVTVGVQVTRCAPVL